MLNCDLRGDDGFQYDAPFVSRLPEYHISVISKEQLKGWSLHFQIVFEKEKGKDKRASDFEFGNRWGRLHFVSGQRKHGCTISHYGTYNLFAYKL